MPRAGSISMVLIARSIFVSVLAAESIFILIPTDHRGGYYTLIPHPPPTQGSEDLDTHRIIGFSVKETFDVYILIVEIDTAYLAAGISNNTC